VAIDYTKHNKKKFMQIIKELSSLIIDNEEIYIYRLKHNNGCTAKITNYGAILMAFEIINNNELQDIVLGFDTVEEYLQPTYKAAYPYFGAVIGRTANRIKEGKFQLNNKEYTLAQNLGKDNLHGGSKGFDSKIWKLIDEGTNPNPFITLQYISPNMEEGFPGELTTTITYTLLENELQYTINAHTNEDTIANFTQHTYFNLNDNKQTIENHFVQLHANTYLEQDAAFNPTGNILKTENTNYDFSLLKKINTNWDAANGYDQSYIIENYDGNMQQAATCNDDNKKLQLQIFTTDPIVHLYTGRWIPEVIGKKNTTYKAYSGLCFETQLHPNGINIPTFPSGILKAGEQYEQKNSYKVVEN
jgi:aldose 1-epimerase